MNVKELKAVNPAISIVTPSFNMIEYLRLCHASVLDQGVSFEHIVMDGGSTDGTVDWLSKQKIEWVSERDHGMYNALNKAIEKSTGEIIGHLNCDEQYLPGVLQFAIDFFVEHPDVDFIAADFLVVDPSGEFVAYRKSFQPKWPYFFSNYLYTNTCTLFYRRKIFRECRFDESYRSIADVIFLYHVIKKGFKGEHVKKYFATFTYSGDNLSLNPISSVEKKKFLNTLPVWYRVARPIFFIFFFIERILSKSYIESSSLSYSIFRSADLTKRVTVTRQNPGYYVKFESSKSLK